LAIYMPIVAGMGGNAATQTLAVMVRGMAFKQLDWRDIKRTLKNEVMAGFYNGLLIGSIVFSITMYLNRNLVISFVLGLAMVTNLVVSAIFGTLVPVVMKKLKKDPASSATIFITTATDVLGFFAFLGLAAILLR
jgi:magnesium transporter